MRQLASTGKEKAKKTVERQMTKEITQRRKSQRGYRLVKGEASGKLATRTEESVSFKTKEQAIAHIRSTGKATQISTLDDSVEGQFNTVGLWKVQPINGEAFFWFVECI